MKKNVLLTVLISLVIMGMSNAQTIGLTPSKQLSKVKVSVPVEQVSNHAIQMGKIQQQSLSPQLKNRFQTLPVKQVLSTKTLKDGSQERVVEMANGIVHKQRIFTNRSSQYRIAPANLSPAATASTTEDALYEGFEAWDGTTATWLPTGWVAEDLSNSGAAFSWQVIGQTEYFAPYAGKYLAYVPFSYSGSGKNIFFLPSEEWLDSPVFTPKQYEKLIFRLNYNPGYMLLNESASTNDALVFNAVNQNIEVWISTDGGMNWSTKIWDAIDDARSYSNADLEYFLNSGGFWNTFIVDLSAYVGQEIQIGFRYKNDLGDSAMLDEIRVGIPQPEAFYRQPRGYFYYTFSEEYNLFVTNNAILTALLGPAYTPTQWLNYSNKESETFEWAFTNPQATSATDPALTFTDITPEINYGYMKVNLPELTAFAPGATPNTYSKEECIYLQTGGTPNYTFSNEPAPVYFGAGNQNLSLGFTAPNYNPNAFVFGSNSDSYWETFGSNRLGISGFRLAGIANYYEKPLSKYVFDRFWIHCDESFAANPDAQFELIIHRVVNGAIADTIATSICYGGDVFAGITFNDGVSYYTMPFTFKATDPETGLESDVYLEIKDAILVELKGFLNQNTVQSFSPFIQAGDNVTGDNYAYSFFTYQGRKYLFSLTDFFGLYTSFLFNMNVIFPFLHSDNTQYDAPVNGGTHDVVIKSYFPPDDWWLSEELPDWVNLGDASNTSGGISLPVIVSALPNGITGRSYNVRLKAPGSSLVIQIKQGDAEYLSGISNVQTEAIQVIRQGNSFQLTYPKAAQSVAVYNIAGQKVAEKALNASGMDFLPAAHLANGVYILKFNGINATVKVIK